jgi:hypothetical protein
MVRSFMRSFARKYTNILNDRHPQYSRGHPVAAFVFGDHKTMLKEDVLIHQSWIHV